MTRIAAIQANAAKNFAGVIKNILNAHLVENGYSYKKVRSRLKFVTRAKNGEHVYVISSTERCAAAQKPEIWVTVDFEEEIVVVTSFIGDSVVKTDTFDAKAQMDTDDKNGAVEMEGLTDGLLSILVHA